MRVRSRFIRPLIESEKTVYLVVGIVVAAAVVGFAAAVYPFIYWVFA